MNASLLKLDDVKAKTSLSKAMIYSLIARKEFPAPVKIGGAARWSSLEIDDWIERAIAARDAQEVA